MKNPKYIMGVDMGTGEDHSALIVTKQTPEGNREIIKTIRTGQSVEEDFEFWTTYYEALGNPEYFIVEEGPARIP